MLSDYLQGFIHLRWGRISSINSITKSCFLMTCYLSIPFLGQLAPLISYGKIIRLQGWHSGRVFQASINNFRKSDNKEWIVNSGKQCHVKVIHIYMIYLIIYLTSSKKWLYFEWSPPWHVGWRLSGEGCHWEYDGKNGEFENIDFRFPWLSDTSEMGFGHDVPFLNYSDRLPHPSDLCQPDRVRWG